MLQQIAFGSLLMVASVVMSGMTFWALELVLARATPWLVQPPHRLKLFMVVIATSLAVMAMVTVSVWLWAVVLHLMGIFQGFEQAMYFTLVTFTTLGYGDVLMPDQWRIMGGLAAVNGLVVFGLTTALMVEALRHVRIRQIEFLKE